MSWPPWTARLATGAAARPPPPGARRSVRLGGRDGRNDRRVELLDLKHEPLLSRVRVSLQAAGDVDAFLVRELVGAVVQLARDGVAIDRKAVEARAGQGVAHLVVCEVALAVPARAAAKD